MSHYKLVETAPENTESEDQIPRYLPPLPIDHTFNSLRLQRKDSAVDLSSRVPRTMPDSSELRHGSAEMKPGDDSEPTTPGYIISSQVDVQVEWQTQPQDDFIRIFGIGPARHLTELKSSEYLRREYKKARRRARWYVRKEAQRQEADKRRISGATKRSVSNKLARRSRGGLTGAHHIRSRMTMTSGRGHRSGTRTDVEKC